MLVGVAAAHAAVYYVDIDHGSNDNNGTSPGSAWQHLPGTVAATGVGWVPLLSGDRVYVRGSTTNRVQVKFATNFYRGSAVYDSIVVMSGHLRDPQWGNSRAVFDEDNVRTYGFWIGGDTPLVGLTVDGFEVRNIAGGGVGYGFDPDSGSSCVVIGGSAPNIHYLKLRRCSLHDAARTIYDTGYGIATAAGSHIIIENNVIGPNIGSKAVGICRVNFGAFRNNYVYNSKDHCLALMSCNNWDVNNNVFRRDPPSQSDASFCLKTDPGSYNDIWNNILMRTNTAYPAPQDLGIDACQGIGLKGVQNRVFHNTIFNMQVVSRATTGPYGAGVCIGYERTAANYNFVQNNMIANCRRSVPVQLYMYEGCASNYVAFNNLYYGPGSDTVMDAFGMTGMVSAIQGRSPTNGNVLRANAQLDARFAGGLLPMSLDEQFRPGTTFFALAKESSEDIRRTQNPLVGDNVHGYSSNSDKFGTDIVGARRKNWSMGAYEFVVVEPASNLKIIQ